MSSQKRIDMAGARFGRLLVVSFSHTKGGGAFWVCRCDCGTETISRAACLRNGSTQSCGCLRRERAGASATSRQATHGKTIGGNQRIYRIWANMISRCYNPKFDAYKWYGARGISVCDEWRAFDSFLADMGDPPHNMTLDRKDQNGNYCKENCRWITQKQQSNNTRANRVLEIDGVSKTVAEWGDAPGSVGAKLIYDRLARGWCAFDAVFRIKKISAPKYYEQYREHAA